MELCALLHGIPLTHFAQKPVRLGADGGRPALASERNESLVRAPLCWLDTALDAVVVLLAKRWDRIAATTRQFRIDLQAARMMWAKEKERDKADVAQKVQERLTELEKQREVQTCTKSSESTLMHCILSS